MKLTSEKRERIIRARARVSTPKQLEYLVRETKLRFKSGTLSQTMHDLILHEIDMRKGRDEAINNKEVGTK